MLLYSTLVFKKTEERLTILRSRRHAKTQAEALEMITMMCEMKNTLHADWWKTGCLLSAEGGLERLQIQGYQQ